MAGLNHTREKSLQIGISIDGTNSSYPNKKRSISQNPSAENSIDVASSGNVSKNPSKAKLIKVQSIYDNS